MVVVALLLVSCASETSEPAASPVPSPTGASASPSASASKPFEGVLLPDGIDGVRFGEPVAQALPALVAMFGEPDSDETIRSRDLYGFLAEPGKDGTLRQVAWDPLTVVFLDTTGTLGQEEVPFAAWHSGWTEAVREVTTPEGIGVGSTLAELRAAYGDDLSVPDERGGPCGISWVFQVETPSGSYDGTFSARPVDDDVVVESIGAGQPPSC